MVTASRLISECQLVGASIWSCFVISYRLTRLIFDLLILRGRRDRSKDAEILVLRHQLAVLERQVPRPRFDKTDRMIISTLARLIDRRRWSAFIVQPATILA